MKPEQQLVFDDFNEAKRIINEAPECGQPLYYNTLNGVYLFTGYRNTYFVNGVWGTEDEHPEMMGQEFKALSLTYLKRLVESLDIIEKFGYDIDGAKQLLDFCKSSKTIKKSGIEITVERLKQAIEDHKAIYDKTGV
ncbi:hypothetical protein Q4100_06330 [Acinetobacter baumannii]